MNRVRLVYCSKKKPLRGETLFQIVLFVHLSLLDVFIHKNGELDITSSSFSALSIINSITQNHKELKIPSSHIWLYGIEYTLAYNGDKKVLSEVHKMVFS